ncbi:MAG: CoA-binding protein [Acidobacteria bacterium 13_1_40CM_3_65_5]|nr:MAG: CoA-binding protein [Acidobacteria bacterium 13_1_40CM_3_65_5]
MTPSEEEELRSLLNRAHTIAVVGLSPNPMRPSNSVAHYLQRSGYTIVPVNPGHAVILGEKSYPTLSDAAREHAIDIVDVFRRSEHAGAVVDEAIALRPAPQLIWLQQGVVDVTAQARAAKAGIPFVMDRCLAIEHRHLQA